MFPTPRQVYESPKWLATRFQILERDAFRCTACGRDRKDGVTLHVHHIKELWKYPELAFESDNLTTLCEECHRGIHNGRSFTYVVRQLPLMLET